MLDKSAPGHCGTKSRFFDFLKVHVFQTQIHYSLESEQLRIRGSPYSPRIFALHRKHPIRIMHVPIMSKMNAMALIIVVFALPFVTQSAFGIVVDQTADFSGGEARNLYSPIPLGPPPLSTPTTSALDGFGASPCTRDETIHQLEVRNEWLGNQLENRDAVIQQKDVEITSLRAHYAASAAIVMERDVEIARLKGLLSCSPAPEAVPVSLAPPTSTPLPTAALISPRSPPMYNPSRPEERFGRQYKTKLCKEFMRGLSANGAGRCRFAGRCVFAHGECQLRPKPKTNAENQMCQMTSFWQKTPSEPVKIRISQ